MASSGLSPTAPSQPTQQTGINQAFNPASKTAYEFSTSQNTTSSQTIDHRDPHSVPSTHNAQPTSTSLGSGETGPLKTRDISASDAQNYSSQGDLEGEQMRAPGEGEVAAAVQQGGGGGHKGEEDLVGNMERKKEEHEQELKRRGMRTAEEVEEERSEDWTGRRGNVDVEEALRREDGGPVAVLAPEE